MRGKITSDLSFCLADDGFSLDELVLKASELYRAKALNEFVKLMLMAAREVLSGRLMRGEHLALSCCGGHDFVLN